MSFGGHSVEEAAREVRSSLLRCLPRTGRVLAVSVWEWTRRLRPELRESRLEGFPERVQRIVRALWALDDALGEEK